MEYAKMGQLRRLSYTMRECLRELRTNIRFSGDDVRVIMFTSVAPNEGKSTVVVDLSRSFADAGDKVLLVDTDMRKSVLVGRYRVRAGETGKAEILGLSHYLSGQRRLPEVTYHTNIDNMDIILAGPSVVNPTELLEKDYFSEMIRLVRQEYDYILIDCAPLGVAIDAAIVAKSCDGAVIVTAQGGVGARTITSVKNQLEASNVRILGAVLNKVKMKQVGYYGKYFGKYSDYYGREEDEQGKK